MDAGGWYSGHPEGVKLVISIDDASAGDVEICELLSKYGLQSKTILYWPVYPNVVNGTKGRDSLTFSQMYRLSSEYQIGSHSLTHPKLTRIPLEQAKNEMVSSRKMLQDSFGQAVFSFCYPRGYSNPEIQLIAKEAGYTSARGVTVGYLHESENPFDQKTTVHCGYDRKEYGGMTWFDYAIYMLQEARKIENPVYHAWLHSYELLAYPNGLKLFESLLKELVDAV